MQKEGIGEDLPFSLVKCPGALSKRSQAGFLQASRPGPISSPKLFFTAPRSRGPLKLELSYQSSRERRCPMPGRKAKYT